MRTNKIQVNTIRVNQVQVNNLSLNNDFFLKGKKPSVVVPSPIAKWECYDYTNDSEGKEVLRDLTGNGHDIQLYNFDFAEASGFGLYGTNFNDWYVDTQQSDVSRTSTSFIITARDTDYLVSSSCRLSSNTTSFTFKFRIVRSDATNINLNIYNFPTDGSATVTETVISNVQVGQVYSYTFEDIPSDYTKRNIYFVVQNAKYLEVELIPDYKGALVSDGVDDYGLCENFPILTKERGYTMLILRDWILRNGINQILVSDNKDTTIGEYITVDNNIVNNVTTRVFGTSINVKSYFNQKGIVVCSSSRYNDFKLVQIGETATQPQLRIFRKAFVALYAMSIYGGDLTSDQLEKVRETMIKRYEEKTGNKYEEVTA